MALEKVVEESAKVSNPADDIFEDEWQTKLLREKLTVRRSWVSVLADIVRNISLDDIVAHWKGIAIAAGAAALICAIFKYDANTREIINTTDSRKPETAVEYNESLFSEYREAIRKASEATGVDARVIKATIYAVHQNPEYAASARAGGKRGVIPLDPVAAGIRPEILDADNELCIRVAAEKYRELRQRLMTDTEAMAALLSSWEDFQKALGNARSRYVVHHGGLGPSGFWEGELRNHEYTLDLIEKHKKGEITGFECYMALTRETQAGSNYYEGRDKRYIKEFEGAISEPPQDPERYIINPRWNPGIRVLREDYLQRVRQIVMPFKDFTIHLPQPAAEAVASARDYLNSHK